MDNEQERNEHFKGFARLLWEELYELYGYIDVRGPLSLNEDDEEHVRYRQLITQRAYDLVVHCINNLSSHDFEPYTYELAKEEVTEDNNDIFSHIPDLTEWPKTTSEASAPDG